MDAIKLSVARGVLDAIHDLVRQRHDARGKAQAARGFLGQLHLAKVGKHEERAGQVEHDVVDRLGRVEPPQRLRMPDHRRTRTLHLCGVDVCWQKHTHCKDTYQLGKQQALLVDVVHLRHKLLVDAGQLVLHVGHLGRGHVGEGQQRRRL